MSIGFLLNVSQLLVLIPAIAVIISSGYLASDSVQEAAKLRNSNTTTTPKPEIEIDEPPIFAYFNDVNFAPNTVSTLQAASVEECTQLCSVGCDFFVYNPATRNCQIKFTVKIAMMALAFRQQTNTNFLPGELTTSVTSIATSTFPSQKDCIKACDDTPDCQFVVFEYTERDYKRITEGSVVCQLKKFNAAPGFIIGYRSNPTMINQVPSKKGRIDYIGSSGVVAIAVNLLPTGKVLVTARPEQFRGGPNVEVVARDKFPWGEIGTVFDPITGTFVPSFIDDNIFCHGAVLMEDGNIFMAGGDATGQPDLAPGFAVGLNKQRIFNSWTNTWTYLHDMVQPRWYPTPVRTVEGDIFVIGGNNGIFPNTVYMDDLEIYRAGRSPNPLITVNLLQRVFGFLYPQVAMIPRTGNIFVFSASKWSILDRRTAQEVEFSDTPIGPELRGGDWVVGAVLLGLEPEKNYDGEFVIFGGAQSEINQVAIDTVVRININQQVKTWTFDNERMPYGRIVMDAILQPNGKVLIMNGARLGKTGADDFGMPLMSGEAMDLFLYDPYKPDGQRWRVMEKSYIRRLYHSVGLLLPDGRTLIAGTDQATLQPTKFYEHRVEAFTPPWLIRPVNRPAITQAPDISGVIRYGTTFTVRYTGAVTKVSLMTPGAATHGVDFTQRLCFLVIEQKTSDTLTIRAPPDPTIMLQGYHMLFLLNDDVPSVAAWIRLGV